MKTASRLRPAVLAAALALLALASAAWAQPNPDWFHRNLVDYGFVAQYAKTPKPEGVMIIDSRPYLAKYAQGYIPTAVSIPDAEFEAKKGLLPADKNTLLIFYCEGPT